jgi:hypothetical protein
MAQYTITINDDDFGVVVNLSGPSNLPDTKGPAGRLAFRLASIAPRLLAQAACECELCQATRERTEQKITLH